MSQMITGSIDLKKINKDKAKAHKNGALYYNITIYVNDEPDKFGNNVSIVEAQTQEERANKATKNYIGNGKVFKKDAPAQEQPAERFEISPEQVKLAKESDNLPF